MYDSIYIAFLKLEDYKYGKSGFEGIEMGSEDME